MTQYYQISETGYPVISSVQLEGFTVYEVGSEPKELSEAVQVQEVKELKDAEIQAAKDYLVSTDFYMTVDKYITLSNERKEELVTKRAEARLVINGGI